MTSNTAPIKWAQRSDSLYLTIELADVKNETINLTDKELHFKGTSAGKDYEVNITFLKKVDAKDSTYKVLPRNIQMHIMKHEDDRDEFWPRLLEDKNLEKNQVQIDWNRYVDEDEQNGGFDTSALDGGMGMGGGMPGMPGMGGMPGMDSMGMGGLSGLMGGDGNMDMNSFMEQLQMNKDQMGGDEGDDIQDEASDEDELEDLPDLEEADTK